ncbi:hypothetical protein SeLEV6574_g05927 [Synchytrium endobioticum]|uniref:Uncharacterized protein n=1 Tax=Synchytrium endobioticum TaxID=286115 RepID=A0A507CRT9_9FUNG|nr:hypothetical protein SeLEV6574_g05927 [Synchytrium endobioticum]
MSTNSDLIKIDPNNSKGTTFKNWKQSVTMLIYSQEKLSKFLDNEIVPPPAPVANETAEARELRVEKHNSDGYKSALLIRQNVVQVVQDQLDIQWQWQSDSSNIQDPKATEEYGRDLSNCSTIGRMLDANVW